MSAGFHESRQVAAWVFALAAVPVLVVVFLVAGGRAEVPLAAAAAVLVVAALVASFAVLRVRVDDEAVSWRFGLGPLGRRIPLRRIAGVEVGETSFWWGYGLRWTRRGWLWRSTGVRAVWLTLEDGRRVGVGSDDSEALAAAIRGRLARAPASPEEA